MRRMGSLQPAITRIGKRGTLVIPAALRQELALEEGTPVTAELHEGGVLITPVVVELLTERERDELLAGANRAYAALHADAGALAAEHAERAVWQGIAGAALSPEGWTDDDVVSLHT